MQALHIFRAVLRFRGVEELLHAVRPATEKEPVGIRRDAQSCLDVVAAEEQAQFADACANEPSSADEREHQPGKHECPARRRQRVARTSNTQKNDERTRRDHRRADRALSAIHEKQRAACACRERKEQRVSRLLHASRKERERRKSNCAHAHHRRVGIRKTEPTCRFRLSKSSFVTLRDA